MNPLHVMVLLLATVFVAIMFTFGLLFKNPTAQKVFESINTYSNILIIFLVVYLTIKGMDVRPLGGLGTLILVILIGGGTCLTVLYLGKMWVILGWTITITAGALYSNIFYLHYDYYGDFTPCALLLLGWTLMAIATWQRFEKKKNGYK